MKVTNINLIFTRTHGVYYGFTQKKKKKKWKTENCCINPRKFVLLLGPGHMASSTPNRTHIPLPSDPGLLFYKNKTNLLSSIRYSNFLFLISSEWIIVLANYVAVAAYFFVIWFCSCAIVVVVWNGNYSIWMNSDWFSGLWIPN